MKQIFVILVALLVASGVQSQTYKQNQELVASETKKLEKRLSEVKDRIYRLESIQKVSPKKGILNPRLDEEKRFAADQLKRLNDEKGKLELAITELKDTGLEGTQYRTQSDIKSNLPEQMGPREYKRRSRSQLFKLSEGCDGAVRGYKGIVANYKIGYNEIASFKISRTDIKNAPIVSLVLNPKETKEVLLPIGKYQSLITCGSYYAVFYFSVDPRDHKWFEGQEVYWATYKAMSDV